MLSYKDAVEAEREAKKQRLMAAHWLRADESKVQSASDQMLVRRFKAAAAEQSDVFDKLLRDYDVNRLFNVGALYFERP